MNTLTQLRSGALKGAVSLKLSEGLTEFPEEIFELAATLEVLDLSRNKLSKLPHDLGRLKKLRILFCSENLFTELPEVIGDCPVLEMVGFKSNAIVTVPARAMHPNLRWLILTDNRIAALPKEIGNCWRMQKLALAGNRLTSLPATMSNCRNLSLLRISANQLTELPEWLLSMPGLSWLAFSGNPFCIVHPIAAPATIDWDQLAIGKVLGEGASGVIYQANWQTGEQPKEVAVKVFKGAVTSDGLPDDEMNAFIAAGAHYGLARLTGQIGGHPDGRQGLVMELIPKSYYNLGLPPSLESCTRDVFKDGMTLSAEQVVKITGTIASVAAQLHSKGILHGDLYAHNTLIDDEANTLFGDFGAASFYNIHDTKTAHSLERIEVRSFGYMIDDLLSVCSENEESPIISKMTRLRDACLIFDVSGRPDFAYLESELKKL